MKNPLRMTNATKANLIAAINAALGLALLFGLHLSTAQVGGIGTAVNALLALFVVTTFSQSPKRTP